MVQGSALLRLLVIVRERVKVETIGFEIAESSSCLAVAGEMGSSKVQIIEVAADDEVVVVVGSLVVVKPQDDEDPSIEIVEIGGGRSWRFTP